MLTIVDQSGSESTNHSLILNQDAFDSFVNEICGGDLEVIADMIEVYLRSLDDLIGQMNRGWQSEDRILLRRAAHSLKSSSRIFGADTLADNCERLEADALANRMANVPLLIERIMKQSREMHLLLAAKLQELSDES